MKLSEKITFLRKSNGFSQEDLAEKLHISRQTVSRWESGSALPDSNNILQISALFGVTTDYLLKDDHPGGDLPRPRSVPGNGSGIMFYLIALEVMILLLQFMTTVILQNAVFALLSFLPFAAVIGGFEYAHRKTTPTERTQTFRRKFYKISAWLGAYFPVRFVICVAASQYGGSISVPVLECIILAVYFCTALLINLSIDQSYLPET